MGLGLVARGTTPAADPITQRGALVEAVIRVDVKVPSRLVRVG